MRKKITLEELEKMAEWAKNYKVYEKLSLEILATIPDDYIEQAIIDHIYRNFTDLETEMDIVSGMSVGLQMVYSTADFGAKLNAGGFKEYFLKTPAQLVEMTLLSLKLIGAIELFQLIQTAQDIYAQESGSMFVISSDSKRTAQTLLDSKKYTSFSECEDAFDKLNISRFVIDYIHKHPEEFVE